MHQTRVLIYASVVLFALGYASMWYFGIFEGLGFHGTIAAILGTLLTTALAVALMALIFHSSRTHYDDRAWREGQRPSKPADDGTERPER